MAQADTPDAGGQTGIEHGTYTWDRARRAVRRAAARRPTWTPTARGDCPIWVGPATVRISADGTTLTAIVRARNAHTSRAQARRTCRNRSVANTAVEYYHADFEHYFATSIAKEISDLDAGVHRGWARTGQSFQVFPLGTPNTADVCRLFSEAFAPRSSHFYSPNRAECELRRRA